MKKRILSTVLWFFAGWYVANILAAVLGATLMIGPLVGIAAAALIGGDPFRVIWTTGPAFPTSAGRTLVASKSNTD